MKNKLLTISKIGLLAFTILVSQACQEDYEMVDPPMITDYDDDLDEEVVLQKGLESYFVTQFGEGYFMGSGNGCSWFSQIIEWIYRSVQEYYLHEPGKICDVRDRRTRGDYPQRH
jgi:hypothetical protein